MNTLKKTDEQKKHESIRIPPARFTPLPPNIKDSKRWCSHDQHPEYKVRSDEESWKIDGDWLPSRRKDERKSFVAGSAQAWGRTAVVANARWASPVQPHEGQKTPGSSTVKVGSLDMCFQVLLEF